MMAILGVVALGTHRWAMLPHASIPLPPRRLVDGKLKWFLQKEYIDDNNQYFKKYY